MSFRHILFNVFVSFSFSITLMAESIWNGSSDGDWNTPANWDATPTNGDNLTFTTSNNTITNNDTSLTNVGDIKIDLSAGNFTLDGNQVTLNGDIIQESLKFQKIDLGLDLAVGNHNVNITGSGGLGLGSLMSGSGGLTYTGGGGSVNVTADNTYTGDTIIQDARVEAFRDKSLGSTTSGTSIIGDSTLFLSRTSSSINIQNAITIGVVSSSGGSIINKSGAESHEVSGDITVEHEAIFENRSPGESLTLSGLMDVKNSTYINVKPDSGTEIEISGNISNSSGSAEIRKNDDGVLVLSGNNTYSGDTKINNGILEIKSSSALGLGGSSLTSISNGSTLRFNSSTSLTISDEDIRIRGSGYGGIGAIQVSDGSHTISSNSYIPVDSTISVDNADDTLTISGVLGDFSNGRVLTKTGSGNLALSGANTYSGGTTVSAGSLYINNGTGSGTGTGALTVSTGATVGGSGSTSGTFTLGSGINLSPGSAGLGDVGELNFTGSPSGNWTADNSTYVWSLSDGGHDLTNLDGVVGTSWDIISFSNTLTIDSTTLAANPITIQIRNQDGSYIGVQGANVFGDTPNYGGTGYDFMIMDNVLFSGGFNESYFNLDSNILFTDWRIAYDGDALYLSYSQVPEPGTWVMIIGVVSLLCFRFYSRYSKNYK